MTEDIETSSTQPPADAAANADAARTVDPAPSADPASIADPAASADAARSAYAAPRAADKVPVQARVAALADDRPEVAVGVAFAGGLVVALILKRLVR